MCRVTLTGVVKGRSKYDAIIYSVEGPASFCISIFQPAEGARAIVQTQTISSSAYIFYVNDWSYIFNFIYISMNANSIVLIFVIIWNGPKLSLPIQIKKKITLCSLCLNVHVYNVNTFWDFYHPCLKTVCFTLLTSVIYLPLH